jgi:hypothetical protein
VVKNIRDEFTADTKRQLAERVAYFCSNPRCLRLTVGPDKGGRRSVRSGHAAHICAAAAGGPRFDPTQTQEERRSIANGIWLCRDCGDIIDKDESGYSTEELELWKAQTEALMAEVRSAGYASSVELLRAQRVNPELAREAIALLDDKRVFWARFDAEFPDRVRISLDNLRYELTALRGRTPSGPLRESLARLAETIRHFFDSIEHIDLVTLRCNSHDPQWREFESALQSLRKAIGIQVNDLADSYGLEVGREFRGGTA